MTLFVRVSLLCSLLWIVVGCSGTSTETSISQPYEFPIQPGTDEWRALKTRDEMLQAVQIPEDQLSAMSSAALLETVLQYPLSDHMYAYIFRQQGLDALKRNFNGIDTLLSRPDAAVLLVEHYQQLDITSVNDFDTLEERGGYTFDVAYVEIMLAQPDMIAQISAEDRRVLLQTTLSNTDKKQTLIDVYGFAGKETNALLAGRLLQAEGALSQPDQVIERFLVEGEYFGDNELAAIYDRIFEAAREEISS
ncbi:MAG: hypothetical protein GFH27_549297n280 [Chloroflexi bacterium AL-W]|nr:hypothetical protein [Chloroflexi bacterium AL-N1]NOK68867.1 hypothetical protein [Chloroflexi bacterium AL-N10]NOK76850.1 hypothetical protein [Chloroflexi bacterium AL-N5]NOK82762.1 hypothetical protein [Chloroflexi bacterium AL-W]NOK90707.1 hypothetical protein [Chloroflexi bacterium AL-N15]